MVSFSDVHVVFFVLSSFLFGWGVGALNNVQKHLVILFQWCGNDHQFTCPEAQDNFSTAMIILMTGATLGSLGGGSILQMGRRLGLQVNHAAYCLGGLIVAFAPHGALVFMTGRFFIGLGLGLTTVVVPVYISEMTPTKIRGSRGVMHQLMITTGILCGIVSGVAVQPITADTVLSSKDAFIIRILLAVPAILGGISLLLSFLFFTYDTPTYLVSKDDAAGAARVLQRVYQKDDIEDELKDIVVAAEEARYRGSGDVGYTTLLGSKYRSLVIFASLLSVGQQVTGINVFCSMSSSIFESAGLPTDWSVMASIAMGFVNTFMTFPALLVDRLGRKTILSFAVVGQTAALSAYVVVASIPALQSVSGYMAVASVIGYIVFFAIGYGPILWLYLPEIFPSEIRGPGSGLASALNWLAAVGTIAFGSRVQSNFVKFAVFAGFSAFFSVMIFAFMRETKGTTSSPYLADPAKEVKLDAERVRLLTP